MTQFELLQLHNMYTSTGMDQFMNYVTILSGYLAASYFAGKKLKLLQFCLTSATYSLFMFISISNEVLAAQQGASILELILEDEMSPLTVLVREGKMLEPSAIINFTYVMAAAMYIVFIGSLVFAYSMRKRDSGDT